MSKVGIYILGWFVEVRHEPIQSDNAAEAPALSNGNHRINVDGALAPEPAEAALLHDMLHIISNILHLGLTEQQVYGLETGLYTAGVRPPKLEEE